MQGTKQIYSLPRICIIGVYFGKLPSYFDLWHRSVKCNSNIDFLLFTDQIIDNVANNLQVIQSDLKGIKTLIESKLGYSVSLEKPYKCCDFRPAFGEIFDDYLKEYDYWGYCDFDMIFGDLSSYFINYRIWEYDRFLPMGHLGLYRNTIDNNQIYKTDIKEKNNYKKVFTDYNNYAFDEQGAKRIFKSLGLPFFEDRIFADISKIYKRFRLALDDINYDNQVFYWEKGKVMRAYYELGNIYYDEFIYIHFKERGALSIYGDCLNSPRFFITQSGFYASDLSCITIQEIKKYNLFPGATVEKQELKTYRKQERYDRIIRRIETLLKIKKNIR